MNEKPKVLLAFDFGTKRIGLAVGQTLTQSARPLATVHWIQGVIDWKTLNQHVEAWQPDALVVGVPLNMDGTEQPLTLLAKEFAENLQQRFNIKVFEVDERLTTREARAQVFDRGGYKALKKTEMDSIAATLILETWFIQQENLDD